MKEYAESFYKSKAWQNTRTAYAKSVGYLCERCLKDNQYVKGEIVHHKKHITPSNIYNPEITLNWNNLELLCRECHSKQHSSTPKRRYTINKDGSISLP